MNHQIDWMVTSVLEVPTIADDTQAKIEEARRYYKKLSGKCNGQNSRHWLFASRLSRVISEGIVVNVTLLFSVDKLY